MFEYVYVGANVFVIVTVVVLLLWREREWNKHFLTMHETYQKVVYSLLDRLMARDLPELVQSKAYAEQQKTEKDVMGIEEFTERLIGS